MIWWTPATGLAGIGDITVSRGIHNDIAAPGPPVAGVLQHREQQEMLDPHLTQVAALFQACDRTGREHLSAGSNLAIAGKVLGARRFRLVAFVVLDADCDGATAAEKRENARVAQEYAGLARGYDQQQMAHAFGLA